MRYGETRLFFDPIESDPSIPELLISHAHYDHVRGFEFPVQRKHSTMETLELYEVDSARKVGNWQQAPYGRRLKIGEVEVEAHDAGHVLGSAQYEVITPEGTVVYASHLSLVETSLSRGADIVQCDILVVEVPFPRAAHSVPRESVAADIVKWALDCVKDHRIPTFATDPIGNGQELVRIFNLWTEIPVIVHPRIARLNKVYELHGVGLRYFDASTEEALHLVEEGHCIVIVPKRFDTSRFGNFRVAHVSERPMDSGDDSQKVFHLTSQANLNQLLRYAEEAKPKSVLTFYGASSVLAQMISKKLGIPARQLTTERPVRKTPSPKINQKRVLQFQDVLTRLIEAPGFTYERRDIVALGLREGFRIVEIEEALERLVRDGKLEYSRISDGYTLTSA